MRFVDTLPEPARRRSQTRVRSLVTELEAQPGRWAEVGRYPEDRAKSAWSRGSQTCRRYPELEYAVRREGSEAVLYFRAAPGASTVNTDHTDTEEPKP